MCKYIIDNRRYTSCGVCVRKVSNSKSDLQGFLGHWWWRYLIYWRGVFSEVFSDKFYCIGRYSQRRTTYTNITEYVLTSQMPPVLKKHFSWRLGWSFRTDFTVYSVCAYSRMFVWYVVIPCGCILWNVDYDTLFMHLHALFWPEMLQVPLICWIIAAVTLSHQGSHLDKWHNIMQWILADMNNRLLVLANLGPELCLN